MGTDTTCWRRWLVAPTLAVLVALAGCGDTPTENNGLDDASVRASHTVNGDATTVDLLADQDLDVGDVHVSDDGTDLNVHINNMEGDWCVTELHIHAADEEDGIPQNGKGNPTPGHFQINEELDCETDIERDLTIPSNDGDVAVAVHTVVEEVVSFPGDEAIDYEQGVNKNGDPVDADRSDPAAALTQDFPDGEFFSLGFMPDGEGGLEDEGGWMHVGFECAIEDGPGDDIRIWEVTFAPYPPEEAEVHAWDADAGEWVLLGTADNSDQGPAGTSDAHTISDFDLGAAGLSSTTALKIVDTTDPGPHNGNADAFDLDGIEALNGCTVREETAWADGERFVDRGNWATFITYDLD